MRSLAILLVSLIAIGACAGDQPPAAQNTCTGATYDPCRDEHDCTLMNCRPFGTIQVCTQSCTASMPCPNDPDGNPVPCTNSLCAPTVANACVR